MLGSAETCENKEGGEMWGLYEMGVQTFGSTKSRRLAVGEREREGKKGDYFGNKFSPHKGHLTLKAAQTGGHLPSPFFSAFVKPPGKQGPTPS